ncbi:MAG: DUF3427 domain-containing protein [Pseudomonadales bacterium]|nr:DUF3427 domain-containing protein [Pseudomonadales bacterium]
MFVTLDKREGYHERIAYHDYAISPSAFTGSRRIPAGPETAAGRRYLESLGNGWTFQLFVRKAKGDPYRACGPVLLERAEGAKPMTIYWKLAVPLPVALFQEFSVLRERDSCLHRATQYCGNEAAKCYTAEPRHLS